MKALFIGSDPSLFTEGSPTRDRMQAYADAIGELIVLSRAPRSAKSYSSRNLALIPVPSLRLLAPFALASAARHIIRTRGVNIVSAQDPFEHGLAARMAAKGTSTSLHIQIHTDFLSPWFTRSGNFRSLKIPAPALNWLRCRIADHVLPHADGIRAVSKRIQESLKTRYGTKIKEASVIPIAVPIALPPSSPLPEHPFSFAFVTAGRIEPEKRIEDILMAIGRLGPRLHSVGLIIVGEGRERKRLQTLAKKLNLTKRVIFTGWRNDVWGLIRNANAYIQASAYEGYGRTLIEAALARVPIITTDVGIIGEVFKGYEDVLSTPVADPVNLAAHMAKLIEDHQLRITLSMNAEHAARNHLAAYADQPALVAADLGRTVLARL